MKNSDDTAIRLENVSKTYTIYDHKTERVKDRILGIFSGTASRKIRALQDVNIEIRKGEFIGVIGHNGSGKSTLLNIMTGAIKPDKGGRVYRNGSYIRLALGMGFNPELSARQNIYLNASILGLSIKEIDERFSQIIEFAELERFVNTQIKFFSSGMRSRLAFSIAVLAEAEIFLMDEFFGGVGDEGFRKKAREVFEESLLKGRTIVHVSHNLETIKAHSNRVLLLDRGRLIHFGNPDEVLETYQNIQKERNKKH